MHVAILGAGISGITLALRLQQLGIETTLYADKAPDEIRSGRLLNTVARFEHTLERERTLGVDHWPDDDYAMQCMHFRSIDPFPFAFSGRPPFPVRAVDFRVLLPRFVEDYIDRGGNVVLTKALDALDFESRHDLVVFAVGRISSMLFSRRPRALSVRRATTDALRRHLRRPRAPRPARPELQRLPRRRRDLPDADLHRPGARNEHPR